MEQTVLHRIVAGTERCVRVFENAHVLVIMNRFPPEEGSLLILPKDAGEATSLKDLDHDKVAYLYIIAWSVLVPQLERAGFAGARVVASSSPAVGMTIPYPHVHVVPYNEGEYTGWAQLQLSWGELEREADRIKTFA